MGSRKHPNHVVDHDTISKENHQEIFKRLASIKNMHGTPGVPKPKKGGK